MNILRHPFLRLAATWCAGAVFVLTTATVRAGDGKDSRRRDAAADKDVLTVLTASTPAITSGCGSIGPSDDQHRHSSDTGGNAFIYGRDDIRMRSTLSVADSLRLVPGVSVRGLR